MPLRTHKLPNQSVSFHSQMDEFQSKQQYFCPNPNNLCLNWTVGIWKPRHFTWAWVSAKIIMSITKHTIEIYELLGFPLQVWPSLSRVRSISSPLVLHWWSHYITSLLLLRTVDTAVSSVRASAANRLIGEVVQSRRRPLPGPTPSVHNILLILSRTTYK